MTAEELSWKSTYRAVDEPVIAGLDVRTDLIMRHPLVAADMRTLDHSFWADPILVLSHAVGAQHSSTSVCTLDIDFGVETVGAF